MALDEIDLRILAALQKDARISNQLLAERVGLSPSPCLRRVRQLEEDGVIRRYVTLLDPRALGHGLHAFVEVRLDRQTRASVDRFEAEIVKFPEVLECHFMAGDADYLLRVVVKDLDEFRAFHMNKLVKVPGVANVKSSISMKQIKYTTEFPVDA
jgi:DNA-binding Lrp family transcriptional regulator